MYATSSTHPTPMALSDYPYLMKTHGPSAVARRALRALLGRIWYRDRSVLFGFGMPDYAYQPPAGFRLKLDRIDTRCEVKRIDPGIRIPPAVLRDRLAQETRMYGTWWQGRIVDYMWVAGPPCYREHTSGFDIPLKSNEIYVFDYKGIVKGRPEGFRHFRLMKAMYWFCFHQERRRAGGDLTALTLVSENNPISMVFHHRFLAARPLGRGQENRLLGIKWAGIVNHDP